MPAVTMHRLGVCAACIALLTSMERIGFAQCETLQRVAGKAVTRLGHSMAVDEAGRVLVVAGDDTAVLVYRDGVFEASLAPPDEYEGGGLGNALAISGDVVVVGAPFFGTLAASPTGAAFVYRREAGAWTLEATLLPSPPLALTRFGGAVAVRDGVILVSARFALQEESYVSVFRRIEGDWIEEARLEPPGPDLGIFGASVALGEDLAFVGMAYEGTGVFDEERGTVHVFRRETDVWIWRQQVASPTPFDEDRFGFAISWSGARLLVGAPGSAWLPGRAYIYEWNGTSLWHPATLTSALGEREAFGHSVHLVGEVALVGAPAGLYYLPPAVGSAERFEDLAGIGWQRVSWIMPSDGVEGDRFGRSVAITAVGNEIGSPRAAIAEGVSGKVYVYPPTPISDCDGDGVEDDCAVVLRVAEDCNRNGISDACDISDASSTDVNRNGVPDECDDCNGNGVADLDDIAAGTSDCNANGTPDACEIDQATPGGDFLCTEDCDPDCNRNGVPDACDISDGSSTDCDTDGVPDDCARDCNGDGVADVCVLADGTSSDYNGNGLPDDCERFETCVHLPLDGGVEDRFGWALDVSGDRAVIGAPRHLVEGTSRGAAYVYRFDGAAWSLEQPLEPATLPFAWSPQLGYAVAIDGERVALGSGGTRRVWLFRLDGSTWIEEAVLEPLELPGSYTFGQTVAIDGNRLAVRGDVGEVTIYERDGDRWRPAHRLSEPDTGAEGFREFGHSIALDGDTILIGAPDRFGGSNPTLGAAYVFRRDGSDWGLDATLTAVNTVPRDRFGSRVDLDGDRAVVGSFATAEWLTRARAAVFRRENGGWIQEASLVTFDAPAAPYEEFGFRGDVAIDGDRIMIGFASSDIAADEAGSVHVFRRVGAAWVFADQILPPEPVPMSRFGAAIAMDGPHALVGQPLLERTRAWPLRSGDADCNGNGTCDDVDIETGTSADRDGDGVPDECPRADLDGDGLVSWTDLVVLLGNWGPCDACRADLDRDGTVGFNDVVLLLGRWGASL